MRRALSETAISAGALGVLLAALAASDSRVREQVAMHLSSKPSTELSAAGREITDLAAVVLDAVRDQSVAHAPLVILVVAAAALVVFMLRT